MRKLRVFGLFFALVLAIYSIPAFSQTGTATISGVISDETGAVIPGVAVTVKDVDTGITRSVTTDDGGRYRVPSLIPDRYEVQAEVTGFETTIRRGIQLTVGAQLEINLILKVGQVSQTTEVIGEAPIVETVSGTIAGLVDDKAIRDLPLNARSFDQLVTLQSSAPQIRLRNDTTGGGVSGPAFGYSSHGARDQSNRYLLDGTEVLQAGTTSNLPGGILGLSLGVEAVREYSVISSNASAEFGKRNGAIVNVVSRSGTNQIHGAAFEFLRNDALDTPNYFDDEKPPFHRNQFGVAIGGPIRKDRTFFFTTYEGLRENLGLSVVEYVPSDESWARAVPSVQPYRIAFPQANGQVFSDGTAEAIFGPAKVSKQDFGLARIDHQISDRDSFFARYNYAGSETKPVSDIIFYDDKGPSSMQTSTLAWTRTSAATVNTLRGGFIRSTYASDNASSIPLPASLNFFPGAEGMGTLSFSLSATLSATAAGGGLLTSRGGGSTNQWMVLNQFELGDEVYHEHGAHSLHFGFSYHRIQNNFYKNSNPFGQFQFTTLDRFLNGTPNSFIGPDPNINPFDPTKAFRQRYFATYIQDNYKLRRNLTLNLGLRWEYMTPPTEARGNKFANYGVHIVDGVSIVNSDPTVGTPYYDSHKNIFAPRIGFGWDVSGNGTTAVRGGVGMFYDQIETEFKGIGFNNRPFLGTTQITTNVPFPLGFSNGAASGLPVPEGIEQGISVPLRIEYNLNVQRQLSTNFAVSLGYVGALGRHLTRRYDHNTAVPTYRADGTVFYPAGQARLNPAVGNSVYLGTDATSTYNAFEVDVTKRLSQGLRYKFSFTWSKNIDTSTASVTIYANGNPNFTMWPDNLGADRGLSSFHVGRNMVQNFTYDLPWTASTNKLTKLLGGWQLSGILTLADGMPFTALSGFNVSRNRNNASADRPNLVGTSLNPMTGVSSGCGSVQAGAQLGGPDQYFDPCAFDVPEAGTYGNVARNTMIAPGFANFDFTLTKVIPVKEGVNVDFRAEFFNLFDRANFGLPSNTLFQNATTRRDTAGKVSTTTNTSRQIQFGLKVLF